jgi:hypothetical protein
MKTLLFSLALLMLMTAFFSVFVPGAPVGFTLVALFSVLIFSTLFGCAILLEVE